MSIFSTSQFFIHFKWKHNIRGWWTRFTACPGSYRVTHGISHATWQNPYLMAKTMQYELCHAMTFLMGYSKTHASHTLQWYEFCHAITSSSCSNDAPLLIMPFNQSNKKCITNPLYIVPSKWVPKKVATPGTFFDTMRMSSSEEED